MSCALQSRRACLVLMLGTSTFLTPVAAGAQKQGAAQEPTPPTQIAMADTAPPPAPDEPPVQDGPVGDIVVTATRQSLSIQKVPISIQALGAEKLEQRQVNGLADFAALLPSVSFEGIGPGRNTAFFRGIVPAGGAYASVGYYLDDIPITGTEVPDIHVYDMERIEALSGPQGTLYGAGSLAGTIRFITQKPKLDMFELGLDVENNKYGKGGFGSQFEGFVNIPIGPTLAARAMGFYSRDGGYIDNRFNNGRFVNGDGVAFSVVRPSVYTLGDNNPATSFPLSNAAIARKDYNTVDEYGGRLQLLWEPIEGWDLSPQVTAQRQIARGYFGFDPRVGDLAVHDFDQTRNDDRWYQAQLSIHGHIGDFELVSATGYFQRKTKTLNDYTYYTVTYDGFGAGYESYLQFFDNCTGSGAAQRCRLINPTQFYHADNDRNKFTQELRLSTPKDWPFDVTLGGFYQRQRNENNIYYAIRGLDRITGYTQTGGGDVAGGLIGVPARFAIDYDDDGVPFFDTSTTINPNGNPLGTMILGTQAVKEDGFYITENNQTYNDKAIFAEGHYAITPTLKITGGIRYFWTDYAITGFAGVKASAANTITSFYVPTKTMGCPTPLPAERLQCLNTNFRAADQTGRYKEDGETHKIAVDWQITPDKMVYANYSTGFRPGGFNRPLRIRILGPVDVAPFKSETLTNYELGVKTSWGNMLRLNAALYYEKWNNIQYGVVVSGAQGAGITGNAGNAEVKGVEYDADLRLGKVTLSTSGAYNDGKLKGNFCNFAVNAATLSISQLSTCALGQSVPGSSPPTPQVAAADGTRLPRQPRFKGTTSLRYDTQLGGYIAFVQGAALYQTGATQDLNVANNALLGETSGFLSFDFSGGVRMDGWSATLFIQNAFDRRGELTRNTFCSIDFCSGSSRTFTIKPQFFGMRISRRFQ